MNAPAGGPSFEPLLRYRSATESLFELTLQRGNAKLHWPGVKITPSQLADLLRSLPSGRRLDGAIRLGQRSATLSFDGKLRRGRLAPPSHPGLILVWTEPPSDLSTLLPLARQPFAPEGECLGRLVLETTGQRAVARIYRHSEQRAPGFVFLRSGQVVRDGDWLNLLDRPEEARLCQVVVEGDLPWEQGPPSGFQSRLQKLARLAAQKSKELLERLPPAQESRALVPSLLESPRLRRRWDARRQQSPPLATLGQILELLQQGGGQRRGSEIRELLGIPAPRFQEILGQIDILLRDGDAFCLSTSLDGEWLFLHTERLIRHFALNPESLASEGQLRATDLQGTERILDLPLVLEPKERRALEALLRYGRLSERELADLLGSRRIGGLLDRLQGRLQAAGCPYLQVHSGTDDGRIYELQAPS